MNFKNDPRCRLLAPIEPFRLPGCGCLAGDNLDYFVCETCGKPVCRNHAATFDIGCPLECPTCYKNSLVEHLKECNKNSSFLGRELENYSEKELRTVVEAVIDYTGGSMAKSRVILEDGNFCIYNNCSSMTDVAKELLKGIFSGSFKQDFDFDYWAYGRDLETRGTFIKLPSDRYLQIY